MYSIKCSNPKMFCRDRTVMPVNKNNTLTRTSYNNDRLGQSFFNLVYPPFEFVLVDL